MWPLRYTCIPMAVIWTNLIKYHYKIHVPYIKILCLAVWDKRRFMFWLYKPDCQKISSPFKVNKGAKIRNRYNQVPHLTQDTNGKVTNSQLDATNESQEVSPFPAGDHKAHINRRARRHSKHKTEKNTKDPQKKYRLGMVSKIFYWRA